MTRKEEIKQAAYAPEHRHYTYADSDVKSFIEGAEWADKTMIAKDYPTDKDGNFPSYENLYNMLWEVFITKACDWLGDNLAKFHWYDPDDENDALLVENFRKAMEE